MIALLFTVVLAAAPAADAGTPPARATLTRLWSEGAMRGPVLALAFSRDGKKIVAGAGDKMARVFDAQTGKLLAELKGASTAVAAVAFSPDGLKVAMGEGAMAVRVFKADTGALEREFPHPDSVSGLTFSPDGALLVVCGHTGTGIVYRVADGTKAWDFSGRNAVFSDDGKRMLTSVPLGALRLWDVATGKKKAELSTAPHLPWVLASGDLSTVATFNPAEKVVKLWDLASGKPAGALAGHEKGVASATLSADGAHAATASEDKTVRLWDVKAQRQVGNQLAEQLAFVALSSDGALLAVAQGSTLTVSRVAW